ncbi:hypothetical protein MBLNU230_g2871t1 [Neophaeotheca triangularis]
MSAILRLLGLGAREKAAAEQAYNIANNPFRAKRTWPPDFSKLSQKHQFRLERRYRRRAKLKWARPTWVKTTKLAQWGIILFVVTYGVLFMEVDKGKTPFDGIREWYREQTKAIWTPRDRVAKKDDTARASSHQT